MLFAGTFPWLNTSILNRTVLPELNGPGVAVERVFRSARSYTGVFTRTGDVSSSVTVVPEFTPTPDTPTVFT